MKATGPPVSDNKAPTETSAANRENCSSSEESIESVGPQTVLPVPTKWTDEKHNMFLTSMESSFLSRLYNNENGSNIIVGCRLYNNPNASNLHGDPSIVASQSACQFKFLRMGRWQTLNTDRKRAQLDIKNETRLLFKNPWIQHFTSRNRPLNQVDSNELVSRAMHAERPMSLNQQLLYCPQDFAGANEELSDQNFVDSDSGEENQTTIARRKRSKYENMKSTVKDESILDAFSNLLCS